MCMLCVCLHVCVHVCVVCMCTCVSACARVCLHVCMCAGLRVCVCACACLHVCVSAVCAGCGVDQADPTSGKDGPQWYPGPTGHWLPHRLYRSGHPSRQVTARSRLGDAREREGGKEREREREREGGRERGSERAVSDD